MNNKSYLLAVDQGTSGTMAALMDTQANIIDTEDIPVALLTPKSGLVEQDPKEIADSVRTSVQQLMARHPEKIEHLLGFGLANQGESFLLWDAESGKSVTRVINWQDGRSAELCKKMIENGEDEWFCSRTGLHLSSEWPALKVAALWEQEPSLRELWSQGKLAYGQLDAWLLYVLTDGKHYCSDHSTACRSGFYNINTLTWDKELIEHFHAERLYFPRLCDNTAQYDGVDLGIGKILPWVAGGLDQSMALLGQRCISPKSLKVTYGTCCACWMNLGEKPALSEHATTSVAWKVGKPVYAMAAEGEASGSIITWLNREFCPQWKTKELSNLAAECEEESSLLFVPAFNGLGSPYWEPSARGTIFGITTGTKPTHILRAGLDAICFMVRDLLSTMPPCESIIVDGGMCTNDYLMQKQADVLGKMLICPENCEGTVTGIGYLMCLSLNLYGSLEEIPEPGTSREIVPQAGQTGYEKWKKAVEAVLSFYQ